MSEKHPLPLARCLMVHVTKTASQLQKEHSERKQKVPDTMMAEDEY